MGLMTTEISSKHLVPVCRQLATSYDAGLPILRTLDMLADNARDSRTKQVFRAMSVDVQGGATLGEAARKQQKYLPRFFIELLHSGELGGRLDVMLRDVADYYEDRLSMQRKIVGAMVYPTIQLVAAWFLGTFALGLVKQLNFDGGKAPDIGAYLEGYVQFQAISMGVALVVVIAIIILSRLGLFKFSWGMVLSYLWPLNTVNRKFSLARFFRSFSLLVGSGMNIKSCIANAAAISGSPRIERDLLTAIPRIASGATLVSAFAPCKSLTPLAREMLEVGEHSGNLEESLRKVAEYHLEEARHAVTVATRILGVLIVLAIGGTIGYIIISFYTRLWSSFDGIL